jgi:hypothetical protein
MWCKGVEAALRDKDPVTALREYHRRLVTNLTDLTAMVRSDLHPLHRCVVVSLVTADVHGRDVGTSSLPYCPSFLRWVHVDEDKERRLCWRFQ